MPGIDTWLTGGNPFGTGSMATGVAAFAPDGSLVAMPGGVTTVWKAVPDGPALPFNPFGSTGTRGTSATFLRYLNGAPCYAYRNGGNSYFGYGDGAGFWANTITVNEGSNGLPFSDMAWNGAQFCTVPIFDAGMGPSTLYYHASSLAGLASGSLPVGMSSAGIVAQGGYLLAFGQCATWPIRRVLRSANASSWTDVTPGSSLYPPDPKNITASPDAVYIVGANGDSIVFTEDAGATWDEFPIVAYGPPFAYYDVYGIQWAGEHLYVWGTEDNTYTWFSIRRWNAADGWSEPQYLPVEPFNQRHGLLVRDDGLVVLFGVDNYTYAGQWTGPFWTGLIGCEEVA